MQMSWKLDQDLPRKMETKLIPEIKIHSTIQVRSRTATNWYRHHRSLVLSTKYTKNKINLETMTPLLWVLELLGTKLAKICKQMIKAAWACNCNPQIVKEMRTMQFHKMPAINQSTRVHNKTSLMILITRCSPRSHASQRQKSESSGLCRSRVTSMQSQVRQKGNSWYRPRAKEMTLAEKTRRRTSNNLSPYRSTGRS